MILLNLIKNFFKGIFYLIGSGISIFSVLIVGVFIILLIISFLAIFWQLFLADLTGIYIR